MLNKSIKIKNDIYTLRYSIETLCLMTEQGYDPMDYLEGNKLLNIPVITKLFYYGLLEKHNKPKMTEKKAAQLITEYCENNGNIYEIATFTSRALADSLGLVVTPDTDENEVEENEGK